MILAKADETSLPERTRRALDGDPHARAIQFEGVWHDWGEVARVARTVARLVERAGVEPMAPVGFVARNHPAAVAALLGLIEAGRPIQMLYAFQSAEALAKDIARLRPSALVAMTQDYAQPVLDALAAGESAAVVLDGMTAAALPGFEQAMRPCDELRTEPQIEVLTSGTTGPPKRFPIGYDLIARHHLGNAMAGSRQLGQAEGPPFLLFYPLGNISGIYSTIPTMLRGQPAILLDRFSLDAWRDFVVRYRPADSGLPPTGFRMLLDANVPAEELASLRTMSTGAAPLDPTVQRAFEERYGIPVLLSYGATEFGGPVARMTPELVAEFGKAKFGSVGRAIPGARLRVVDPGTGAALPPGEEGLLEVVSPRIGPEWIRTSDLAVLDADGFLYLRGRADGAIMRGGFKLVPETIERTLLLHPSIGAASVVAVPDARLGQVPGAAIQLRVGAEPVDPAEVEAHLRAHLPATHIPVHWRFVADLPKNPSMKIDRPGVLRLFEEWGATKGPG